MSTSFMPDGIPVNLAPPGIPPVARMLAGMGLATLGGALTIIQPPK
ncbi:MAG TPA: hypothetical protein VJH24_06250 [Candidatus Bilamarchaeaceae archaeon]|nr:hypothetical protein [Candidatus Bilamarchaeaceae archaeon]